MSTHVYALTYAHVNVTIRSQGATDCDRLMAHILGHAFPAEATATVTNRKTEQIDVTPMNGPKVHVDGETITDYRINLVRGLDIGHEAAGPRIIQP
jgi:hypothetical protein